MNYLTQIDLNILNAVQSLHGSFLDRLMIIMSRLGSWAVPWIITAAVLLLWRGRRKHGAVILLAMALGLLLGSGILKHIVMRERPFAHELGLFTLSDLLIPAPADRYSFPSGHALTSFAAATSIFLWNKRCGAVAFIVAAAIAFSRVYLYVHFPIDVLAGVLIGIPCAFIARWIVDKIEHRMKTDKL
ncbi:MAG: phosphatase PAP2 family protein [Oscillospiraceae bacterium]|nr:phosphatase PAP2 family protein [Oscillospiraceae bacterium]